MSHHSFFLQEAVKESARSVKQGHSPFGAVIVKDDIIIAKAHNQVVKRQDPTAHAEVSCIRKACRKLKTHDLKGCILYTSCEPCPMCLNSAKWANITQIFYAASREDADAIGFRDKIFYEEAVVSLKCIQLKEAREIMDDWFNRTDKKPY